MSGGGISARRRHVQPKRNEVLATLKRGLYAVIHMLKDLQAMQASYVGGKGM